MKKLDQIKQTISNHMRLDSQELSNLMKELKQLSDKELEELDNDVELHWESMREMAQTIENKTDQFHWNNRSRAIRTIRDFVNEGVKREIVRFHNLTKKEQFQEESDQFLFDRRDAILSVLSEGMSQDQIPTFVDDLNLVNEVLLERGVA